MIRTFALSTALLLNGCAFPKQIGRMGVEYNSALSHMANEQTFLNILRAKEGMPPHFTSVSRFTGNLSVTGTGSLAGQIKGAGANSTITNATGTASVTDAAGVVTTVTPGATSSIANAIAEGVDAYSPSVGGQLVSGTSFDVAIFDTQIFYQGITTALPFKTVETYINQQFDEELLKYLLIARIDFRAKETVGRYVKGELVRSIVNDPKKPDEFNNEFVKCYKLSGKNEQNDPVRIAAMSRFTLNEVGKAIPLDMGKIGLIDGKKYDLSSDSGLEHGANTDNSIYLRRLAEASRMPLLRLLDDQDNECVGNFTITGSSSKSYGLKSGALPPEKKVYLNDGKMLVAVPNPNKSKTEPSFLAAAIDVNLEITFRSTEGVLRYLGEYLRHHESSSENSLGGPLFLVQRGSASNAKVHARLLNQNYSIASGRDSVRNMQVITLVQQLINLHKESSERPQTIPVRALP